MGQKVHPLGFRLGVTQDHGSHWVARRKGNYAKLVREDNLLRTTVEERFKEAGIVSIGIEREVDRISLFILASKPRAMFKEATLNVGPLNAFLTKKVMDHRSTLSHLWNKPLSRPQLGVRITKIKQAETCARCVADSVVEQLERRVPFRKAVKSAIKKAQDAHVKGIKVQVSGRLNGAEIARTEWVRRGRVPLQTLRAKMGYSCQTATTIYGLLGIKVWVFEGVKPTK